MNRQPAPRGLEGLIRAAATPAQWAAQQQAAQATLALVQPFAPGVIMDALAAWKPVLSGDGAGAGSGNQALAGPLARVVRALAAAEEAPAPAQARAGPGAKAQPWWWPGVAAVTAGPAAAPGRKPATLFPSTLPKDLIDNLARKLTSSQGEQPAARPEGFPWWPAINPAVFLATKGSRAVAGGAALGGQPNRTGGAAAKSVPGTPTMQPLEELLQPAMPALNASLAALEGLVRATPLDALLPASQRPSAASRARQAAWHDTAVGAQQVGKAIDAGLHGMAGLLPFLPKDFSVASLLEGDAPTLAGKAVRGAMAAADGATGQTLPQRVALGGLRGLAARGVVHAPRCHTPQGSAEPAPSGANEAPMPVPQACAPPDDEQLARQLARVLRREAARDGIDISDVQP